MENCSIEVGNSVNIKRSDGKSKKNESSEKLLSEFSSTFVNYSTIIPIQPHLNEVRIQDILQLN